MFFRSQKKSAGDLSLSDSIDMDGEGNSLSLIDVLAEESDLLENVSVAELCRQVRESVDRVLDPREARIIRLRYGLPAGENDGEASPMTQREVAAATGISRSYVSRRAYCKRCSETVVAQGVQGIGRFGGRAALIVNGGKLG